MLWRVISKVTHEIVRKVSPDVESFLLSTPLCCKRGLLHPAKDRKQEIQKVEDLRNKITDGNTKKKYSFGTIVMPVASRVGTFQFGGSRMAKEQSGAWITQPLLMHTDARKIHTVRDLTPHGPTPWD